MLPQKFVQPKNKVAYTLALLQNLEHGADAFDPGGDEDDRFDAPSSFVVTADHGP